MKIKSVRIKNFRAIKDQTITCNSQTIFIGANGTGKSTVLKALQSFFDISFKPQSDDYFARDSKIPIEVTVTFSHFTADERKDFESRIHNDEMTVTRAFGGEAGETGTYHGQAMGCADFKDVRMATKAADKKLAYTALTDAGFDLPKWTNQGDAENALLEWEQKNPSKCTLNKDGGQFFGFKSVGAGKLQRAANFIMIEAVRDVSEDANDQKSSVIAQIMDLIVRSAMQQNEKISKYQEQVNQEYAALTKPDSFPQLGALQANLTESLETYYKDVGVKLDWKETSGVSLPPPQARISLSEDDFEYPVERAGNGVQRAFIISLLHQLLVAKSNSAPADAANDNPAEGQEAETPQKNLLEKLPSVILAIEEPELYQHPTKQWHFAQVLKELSSGALAGTFGDVQVIICTHSPNFVNLSEFQDLRITSKVKCDETGVKNTAVRNAALTDVAKIIERVWQKTAGSCTAESTKALLHIFGTELSEGFFADGVVLVEGVTDKAAFEAVAKMTGKSFVKENIAVLSVSGKNNIDKPWMVFHQLGIPVFPVWDSDSDLTGSDRTSAITNNKALQRMLGVAEGGLEDFPAGVKAEYASFDKDLNAQLKADFVAEYDAAFQEAVQAFNLTADKGRKNPYVIADTIERLYKAGKKSETLEAIVDAAFKHLQGKNTAPAAKKQAA